MENIWLKTTLDIFSQHLSKYTFYTLKMDLNVKGIDITVHFILLTICNLLI